MHMKNIQTQMDTWIKWDIGCLTANIKRLIFEEEDMELGFLT